jgi:hypothetical protein
MEHLENSARQVKMRYLVPVDPGTLPMLQRPCHESHRLPEESPDARAKAINMAAEDFTDEG